MGNSGRGHKDGIQRTESRPPLVHARLDVDVAELVVVPSRNVQQHVLLDGPRPETVLVSLRRGRGDGRERRRLALDIAYVVALLRRGDEGGQGGCYGLQPLGTGHAYVRGSLAEPGPQPILEARLQRGQRGQLRLQLLRPGTARYRFGLQLRHLVQQLLLLPPQSYHLRLLAVPVVLFAALLARPHARPLPALLQARDLPHRVEDVGRAEVLGRHALQPALQTLHLLPQPDPFTMDHVQQVPQLVLGLVQNSGPGTVRSGRYRGRGAVFGGRLGAEPGILDRGAAIVLRSAAVRVAPTPRQRGRLAAARLAGDSPPHLARLPFVDPPRGRARERQRDVRVLGARGRRHHGRPRGRRGGHLVAEIRERLDDEVPKLEKGADLILQLLQGEQRFRLLAYQVVKRARTQGHAIHATAAAAAVTTAPAPAHTPDDALRRPSAAATL